MAMTKEGRGPYLSEQPADERTHKERLGWMGLSTGGRSRGHRFPGRRGGWLVEEMLEPMETRQPTGGAEGALEMEEKSVRDQSENALAPTACCLMASVTL